MEFSELINRIQTQYDRQLPFVVYATPGSDTVYGVLQNDTNRYVTTEFLESGFVFAPFLQEEILLIPNDKSEQVTASIPDVLPQKIETKAAVVTKDKSAYLKLVMKALDCIRTSNVTKIVTSRKIRLSIKNLDLSVLLHRLFGIYADAFRYIWFHPSTGIWVAATPEVLLQVKQREFSTMALAGTQPYVSGKEPKWTSKEIEEQQWVTDDIAEKLQKMTSIVKVSKTKNHRAGSLVHLRTDFVGVFKKNSAYLPTTIKNLHPTPAICGTPRNMARLFIKEEEGYEREFYAGYVGPIDNLLKTAKLFVNLRCMKVQDSEIQLYVGGGITSDSDANLEWEETQNKMQTMLQVIAPMLSH